MRQLQHRPHYQPEKTAPRYFKELAVIAADLLGSLEADTRDLASEKRLVLSEIRESNQHNDINNISSKYIWNGTNLQNPVLGSMQSIKALTVPLLAAEKEKTFTKNNIFFYITGNFSDDDVSWLAEEAGRYNLSDRADHQNSNLVQIPDGFMHRNALTKIFQRKFFMHDVRISFDIDLKKLKQREIAYLDSILSDGLCSPLRAEVIERKGLIYSFSSTIEQYANIGVYYFQLEVHKSRLYETVKSFVSVLDSVKKGIAEEDMATTRVFKTENQLELLDDPESLNWAMAYENHILNNNYHDISEVAEAYGKINRESLAETAGEIFKPENVTFMSIGNKKGLSEKRVHDILCGL